MIAMNKEQRKWAGGAFASAGVTLLLAGLIMIRLDDASYEYDGFLFLLGSVIFLLHAAWYYLYHPRH
jgi:hypothetical protein